MRATGFGAMRVAVIVGAVFGTAWLTGCAPEYPNCNTDEDCHEGEFCVNGQCQQCRTDADCPTGQRCAEGRCEPIPGFCESNTDCPQGQECRNNQCVQVQQQTTEMPEPEPGEPTCSVQTVHFAFDSSSLDQTARDRLQSNADCIQKRDVDEVHLTGHCDPRGTEEYNLALGERRARSVKKYLKSLGVSGNTITISSMGEEMADGHNEETWADDRRVEFDLR